MRIDGFLPRAHRLGTRLPRREHGDEFSRFLHTGEIAFERCPHRLERAERAAQKRFVADEEHAAAIDKQPRKRFRKPFCFFVRQQDDFFEKHAALQKRVAHGGVFHRLGGIFLVA